MKHLIVISLMLAIAHGLTPEQVDAMKKQIMQMADDCQKDMGATAADLTVLMQKKTPTEKVAKCFLFCMHKKIKFQDDSGKLNVAGVDAWINDLKAMDEDFSAKMKQVADKCIPLIDDSGDPCDTATSTYECYTRVSAEMAVQMII